MHGLAVFGSFLNGPKNAAASPLASIHDKTVLMGSRTGIGKFNPQDGRSWIARVK
jgi:hypothetical protein